MSHSADDKTGDATGDPAHSDGAAEQGQDRPAQQQAGGGYGPEAEPTHLITFDDEPDPEPEPTHLITFDDEPEPTHLITFDDDLDDGGDPTPQGAQEITDPTLPPIADRGQELRRYRTDEHAESTDASPAEDPLFELEGLAASAYLDDDPSGPSFSDLDDSLRLDLEVDSRQSPTRQPPDPEPAPPADAPSLAAPAPPAEKSRARRFTVMVRDRAQTHFEDILASPRRAIILALTAAMAVLATGAVALYISLTHAHLDTGLARVEEAIDADLYSSHLAALRDLQALQDHHTLPIPIADAVATAIVDRLPFVSPAAKRRRIDDLQLFVAARLEYRFAVPGDHTPESLPDPDRRPLLTAAALYRALSIDDFREATTLGESLYRRDIDDPYALLAYGDLLTQRAHDDHLDLVAQSYPTHTSAHRFVAAKLQRRRDQTERALDLLAPLINEAPDPHPGAILKRAQWSDTGLDTDDDLQKLTDPNHAHAAPVERAQALAWRALEDDEISASTRHQRLEAAAELARRRPEAVRPYIDALLDAGELESARRYLLRTPDATRQHPYFDLSTARLHLLFGDYQRAIDILETYAFDHRLATAMMAIAYGLSDQLSEARALADSLAESAPDAAAMLRSWTAALAGEFDADIVDLNTSTALGDAPIVNALAHETLRKQANLADSRREQNRILSALEDLATQDLASGPEWRLSTCLSALDARRARRAQQACSLVDERDGATRPALAAILRWFQYADDQESAWQAFRAHSRQAGPSSKLRLLEAEFALESGDLDRSQEILDDLPAELQFTPPALTISGDLALANEEFSRAIDHFVEAQQSQEKFLPTASLGFVEAHLELRERAESADDNDRAGDGDSSDSSVGEDLDQLLEDQLRRLLRHGAYAPRAWTLFARLRRLQDRPRDAAENLAFARRARREFGPPNEQRAILTEERAQLRERFSANHRRVKAIDDAIEDLDAP